jgi:peptide-methionine (S)-S-oxide reductase
MAKTAGKSSVGEQNQFDREDRHEVATLAGGCFWCLEAVFSEIEGVHDVTAGYSGGMTSNPSYEDVSTGSTGHAEAVQIVFDPKVISFEEILKIFFTTHDPTTLNRQGPDIGSQYRSAIFFHSEAQKKIAQNIIQRLAIEKIWSAPIVTEVKPFEYFYKAEDYHQKYYQRNQQAPYCQLVINPKLAKLRREYQHKLKSPAA